MYRIKITIADGSTTLCLGIPAVTVKSCTVNGLFLIYDYIHRHSTPPLASYSTLDYIWYVVEHTLSNQRGLSSLVLGNLEGTVPLARGTVRLPLFRHVHLKKFEQ